MKKLFIFLLILFVSNCSTKKLENNHGLVNLDKKKDEIIIGKTNKNDILNLFGPASTVSTFDDDIWIYIESKKINQSIFKSGKHLIIFSTKSIEGLFLPDNICETVALLTPILSAKLLDLNPLYSIHFFILSCILKHQ